MKTTLAHLQVNVKPENLAFYRDLFAFLGWDVLYDGDGILGVGTDQKASLWFTPVASDAANDYDGVGINHIGVGAVSQGDVDRTAEYLRERGIATLFETPRHRPEFAGGEGQTYYQVMFKSPDPVLFEVVYTGPKG